MKYERIKLLQHPVTQALISHKWKAYAMPYSIIILALYLVFLAGLTAFATVMPFPIGRECNITTNCEGSYNILLADQTQLAIATCIILDVYYSA